jgi:hypothetical protein
VFSVTFQASEQVREKVQGEKNLEISVVESHDSFSIPKEETHMFYLISKDPMTHYLLRIEKSFCNDNFRINLLLFFLTSNHTMIERSLSF